MHSAAGFYGRRTSECTGVVADVSEELQVANNLPLCRTSSENLLALWHMSEDLDWFLSVSSLFFRTIQENRLILVLLGRLASDHCIIGRLERSVQDVWTHFAYCTRRAFRIDMQELSDTSCD